jgi:transposase
MPRAGKVCHVPRCPNLVPCAEHKRPSRQARGYDAEYERERRALPPPPPTCPTCDQPMVKATSGHRTAIRAGGKASDGLQWQCEPCNYGWRRTGL